MKINVKGKPRSSSTVTLMFGCMCRSVQPTDESSAWGGKRSVR
jgi:hypothetical protein